MIASVECSEVEYRTLGFVPELATGGMHLASPTECFLVLMQITCGGVDAPGDPALGRRRVGADDALRLSAK
jgi:hypothetical protein